MPSSIEQGTNGSLNGFESSSDAEVMIAMDQIGVDEFLDRINDPNLKSDILLDLNNGRIAIKPKEGVRVNYSKEVEHPDENIATVDCTGFVCLSERPLDVGALAIVLEEDGTRTLYGDSRVALTDDGEVDHERPPIVGISDSEVSKLSFEYIPSVE